MMQVNTHYRFGYGNTMEEQLTSVFADYKQNGITTRLVFFGNPADNNEYLTHLQLLSQSVSGHFGDKPPVFSYVAQPPLGGSELVMEVVEIMPEPGMQIYYRQRKDIPYIIVESPECKKLYLGGIIADPLALSIRKQSDVICSTLKDILRFEKMPVTSIIRQWNYIEQIVKNTNGHQNYQVFNDSRTCFYNHARWEHGYPAATGVGTCCGGVMIDLEALYSDNDNMEVVALNNSLQVPAHAYSPGVLIGQADEQSGQKTTPKFERAKLIRSGNKGFIYISGTAAIRGEMSLKHVGIEEQTRITLENIEHILSWETFKSAGIEGEPDARLSSIRVYLKDSQFFESAKKIVDEKYAGLPVVYLLADVCRVELLVEIEGFASLVF